MSEGSAMTVLRKLCQIVWHLTCVGMLTAFVGLVSVRNDYYGGGASDSEPLTVPLAVGIALSALVMLVHAVQWKRQHPRKGQNRL